MFYAESFDIGNKTCSNAVITPFQVMLFAMNEADIYGIIDKTHIMCLKCFPQIVHNQLVLESVRVP